MSYIIRVVGYNAYWTGDTEPGKCWSTEVSDSQLFDTQKEAQVIVDSGNNMEVVEYDFALSDRHQDIFDWDAIDRKADEINMMKNQEILEVNDFETISDEVEEVDVEVLD